MTAKLNQVIAVRQGVQSTAHRDITALHHAVQKTPLLSGISRTYQPKDEEDGDHLPSESTRVQINAGDLLRDLAAIVTRQLDVTASIDATNCGAVGSVKLGDSADTVLLPAVPVTTLMYLDRELTNLITFLRKLPVLDPADQWTFSDAANAYATPVTQTVRTKKVPRNHVRAVATKEHAAQVDVYNEDVIVGTWSTTKFSGALPAARVAQLVERAERLQAAVRAAREEANAAEVVDRKIGADLFTWLLAE